MARTTAIPFLLGQDAPILRRTSQPLHRTTGSAKERIGSCNTDGGRLQPDAARHFGEAMQAKAPGRGGSRIGRPQVSGDAAAITPFDVPGSAVEVA